MFSKDFISAFNILSILAMSFFSVPNSPFLIKSKSPISLNKVCMTFARLSTLSGYAYQLRRDKCNSLAFHPAATSRAVSPSQRAGASLPRRSRVTAGGLTARLVAAGLRRDVAASAAQAGPHLRT